MARTAGMPVRKAWLRRAASWSARWLGLTGAALIVTGWVASMFGDAFIASAWGKHGVMRGALLLDTFSSGETNFQADRTMGPLANDQSYHTLDLEFAVLAWRPYAFQLRPAYWSVRWYRLGNRASEGVLIIPLWMPLLAFAASTGIAWWSFRGQADAGRCASCGYDLSGLKPEAVCPECGRSGAPT